MLEIRTLGQFQVRFDGHMLEIPTRPAQSLLAYLAFNAGMTFRRERLAGLFWPDSTEENARNYLRQALWRLRRSLDETAPTSGAYLQVGEIDLSFNPGSDYWLDSNVLLRRKQEVGWSVGELIEAVEVYRGELLPGFYDEWVILERERLNAAYDHKMQLLIERLLQEQRWDQVLERSETWVSFGRVPEPAYRALMMAQAGIGNRAGITATYKRLVAALEEELGLEPSEELLALRQQLSGGIMPADTLDAKPGDAISKMGEPAIPGNPPYKGLAYFDVADAERFFGREELTAALVRRLEEHPFLLLVVGASGSGKSSIVRAGLVSALMKGDPLSDGTMPPEGSQGWLFHVLTPTARPLEALADSLTRQTQTPADKAMLMQDMTGNPGALRVAASQLVQEHHAERIMIVVDQFEELFTLCQNETERRAFIENLLAAADPRTNGPALVVLALRADFYAHCARYPELRMALARHQEYIGPMSTRELRTAIEKPAENGGWRFEPGLVDLILRDVKEEPGRLPLLSHALLETWRRRSGRTLTLEGYAQTGGVQRAIARTAESVYNLLLSEDQQSIARNVFLRLTGVGKAIEETRRRAALAELLPDPHSADEVRRVLHILADARLIVLDEDMVEVAHEALIREWPTLRQWLDEDQGGLRLHRHITESALEWDHMGRDAGELYRGPRLAQALEWAGTHAALLNALERAFLEASREQAERQAAEREAQRRRELEAAQRAAQAEKQRAEEQARAARQLKRRAFYLAGVLVLTTLMAAVAILLGGQARRAAVTAQRESRIAFARELVAAALGSLDVDPERSILLALEAVSATQSAGLPVLPEVEDALHRSVQASRVQLVLPAYDPGSPIEVSFSPDGRRLATAQRGGGTKVWDLETAEMVLSVEGEFVAYSPDGRRLATVTASGLVKLWDAVSGEEMPVPVPVRSALGVSFSPDGGRLATTTGFNATAKIWGLSAGTEPLTLSGHSVWTWFAHFSPDGGRLITAAADETVRVWDAVTGDLLMILSGHDGDVTNAVFSPDGTRIGTASRDGRARLWDAASGELLLELRGHTSEVTNIAFSPNGERVATGSRDRKVKVWDADTGQESFTLSGHAGAIYGLQFSPDGTRLASGSFDGTVRVWAVTPGSEWISLATPEGAGQIAFSPDGRRLAAATGEQGAGTVWDFSTGRPLLNLPEGSHAGALLGLDYSPNGLQFATAGADGTAKTWDAATGELLLTLSGHDNWINDVAFSPDGTRLVTVSSDRSMRMWAMPTQDTATTVNRPAFALTGASEVWSVDFSPDGELLATASHLAAKVWRISAAAGGGAAAEELFTLRGHSDTVRDVAFSPDGTLLATASLDGTARIWGISEALKAGAATAEPLTVLVGHAGAVVAVAFNQDGTRLATASRDGSAKIWDIATALSTGAATAQEIVSFTSGGAGLSGVAYSPDGRYLATGGDDAVRVYLVQIDDLAAMARSLVSRALTVAECQRYLHREAEACAPEAPIPTATTLAPPAGRRACLLTDPAGPEGEAFSYMIREGGLAAAASFNWQVAAGLPAGADRFSQRPAGDKTRGEFNVDGSIRQFLTADCDLIVAPSTTADALRLIASDSPEQRFQILDFSYNPPLDNVWSGRYASDQPAFLAGYLAASLTKTGKVGTFGAINFYPPVADIMDGFALGVAYYNEEKGGNVEVLGWDVERRKGLFVGSYCCQKEGQALAEQLLDQGADIILPVAGQYAGHGAATAVQLRGDGYLIGTDFDWVARYPEYGRILLTSIEKRVEASIGRAIGAIRDSRFRGGTYSGTLESAEVGLSPFYRLDDLVPDQLKAELERLEDQIIAGKIQTRPEDPD